MVVLGVLTPSQVAKWSDVCETCNRMYVDKRINTVEQNIRIHTQIYRGIKNDQHITNGKGQFY
jgi:hypothetical protein